MTGAEKPGVSGWEAEDYGLDTDDAQVGGGPREGAVVTGGASGWDGGAGVETRGRGETI